MPCREQDVIMVGPTGSGKADPLAMLNLINSPSRNILTIENPLNMSCRILRSRLIPIRISTFQNPSCSFETNLM